MTDYTLFCETGRFHSRLNPLLAEGQPNEPHGGEDTGHDEAGDAPATSDAPDAPALTPAPLPEGACHYCKKVGGHDYSVVHPANVLE